MSSTGTDCLATLKQQYSEKFATEEQIFSNIHRGDRIFIGTGCGEPQYLVNALIKYVEAHPKAFFDTEVFHVWTLGVAPYADKKFKQNFRHNSFFIGSNTRDAINEVEPRLRRVQPSQELPRPAGQPVTPARPQMPKPPEEAQ